MAAKDSDDRKQDAAAKEPMVDISQTSSSVMTGSLNTPG